MSKVTHYPADADLYHLAVRGIAFRGALLLPEEYVRQKPFGVGASMSPEYTNVVSDLFAVAALFGRVVEGVVDHADLHTLLLSGALPAQRHKRAPYRVANWPIGGEPYVRDLTDLFDEWGVSAATHHGYARTLRDEGLTTARVLRWHDVMWLYVQPLLMGATLPEKLRRNMPLLIWVAAHVRQARPQRVARPSRVTATELARAAELVRGRAEIKPSLARFWLGEPDYPAPFRQERSLERAWAARRLTYEADAA